MPQNTAAPIAGVEVGYQNPGTVNLALDAEVVGPDPVTGAQLTREFVVPQQSVSGQDPYSALIGLMESMLVELKKIRICMEADTVPGITDEVAPEEAANIGAEEETGGGSEEN